ncbi:MAG: macro domain-containing protein [Acholeplasmataceae bacterium]
MPFSIIRADITTMAVDAIVNSTSSLPLIGEGVDLSIYRAAGPKLFEARKAFGVLRTAQAVMTAGYDLCAKSVIHVAGPIHGSATYDEEEMLGRTYRNALGLALEHGVESIAFPLISAGAFQFPRGRALAIALEEIKDFLDDHEMMIHLLVYDDASYQLSRERFITVASYIDRHGRDAATEPMTDGISYARIPAERSLDDIIDEAESTFAEALFRWIDRKGFDDVSLYKKANIDRKLFSKIKSNADYQPSKKTALSFALALELNLDETVDFLARAGYALSPSSRFDLIIRYFIERQIYDLYEINQALFSLTRTSL